MLTVDTRFQQIAVALIEERISGVTDEIAAGQLPDYASYTRNAGRLQGLREAMELLGDAQTKLTKER